MKERFLRYFFGEVEPFEEVDFFKYQVSPYILDRKKRGLLLKQLKVLDGIV